MSTSAAQCPHCGFPLASAPYAPPPPPPMPAQWSGPAAPPPSGRGIGTGVIVAVVAGVGLLGLLAFVGLIALGASMDSETRAMSDSTVAFSATDTTYGDTVATVPGVPAGNWSVSEDTSEMDGTPTVVLTAVADAEIEGRANSARPSLIVRCREGTTDVFVATGLQANPEYGHYQEVTIRYRLDEASPRRQLWSESTSGEALFAPEPVSLARAMTRASSFRFEFTPFQSSAQTVTFAVAGLEEKLARVANACHWHI
ncbi:hypothetical protein [Longimicrobium sp.]|uniref:hypothetical protein n=1 Tax=Longimicrobium sp. TaxID=2029185 RepID=UPI002D7EC9E3|nr:hypothetical protein [Longimicrobium sp.]